MVPSGDQLPLRTDGLSIAGSMVTQPLPSSAFMGKTRILEQLGEKKHRISTREQAKKHEEGEEEGEEEGGRRKEEGESPRNARMESRGGE